MRIYIPHYLLTLLAILIIPSLLFAQTQPPQSDPQAVLLAQQSAAALTNGVVLSDVTLTGNATWIAGSDEETGAVSLQAKGMAESRIELVLSGGTRTEIRNSSSAASPQGETITADGATQWAQHNCWVNAAWFSPASSLLGASDPSVVLTFVGAEKRGSASVQHIRTYRYIASKSGALTSLVQALSTQDIYLDSATLVPVAFVFNVHPENDEGMNILVEIDFSSYQPINGVLVPMRVQKLINGGLALDIAITGVALNTGLTDTPFAIQ